jgi:hypothetical protein
LIDDDLAGIPCALGSLLLVAAFVVALWLAFRDGPGRAGVGRPQDAAKLAAAAGADSALGHAARAALDGGSRPVAKFNNYV